MNLVENKRILRQLESVSAMAVLALSLAACADAHIATPTRQPSPSPRPTIVRTPLVLALKTPQLTATIAETPVPIDMRVQQKAIEIANSVPATGTENLILKSIYLGKTYPTLQGVTPDIFPYPVPVNFDTTPDFAQFNFGKRSDGKKQVDFEMGGQKWTYSVINKLNPTIRFSQDWLDAPEEVKKLIMLKEAYTPILWSELRKMMTSSFLKQGGKITAHDVTTQTQTKIADIIAWDAHSGSKEIRFAFDYAGYLAVFPMISTMSDTGKQYLAEHTNMMKVYEFAQQNGISTSTPALIWGKDGSTLMISPAFSALAFGEGRWTKKIKEIASVTPETE